LLDKKLFQNMQEVHGHYDDKVPGEETSLKK